MLVHVRGLLVASVVLGGCHKASAPPPREVTGEAGSAHGGDAEENTATTDQGERVVEPESVVEPERAVLPDFQVIDDEHVRVAGRVVEVRIDGDVSSVESLMIAIDGATKGNQLLTLPLAFEGYICDLVQAFVEPVRGVGSPLALSSACCFFHKDSNDYERCLVALIHVGDDATSPRVLWQGSSHHDALDGCTDFGSPRVEVIEPGKVVIEQVTAVVKRGNPERRDTRCKLEEGRARTLTEITF